MTRTAITTESVWLALSADLRAFLRSRVSSDADADDLLQDVFVRVYQGSGSLHQAERVESWVYQIARNAVADFYRRQKPRPAQPVEDVADPQTVCIGSDNHNRAVGAWLSLMIDMIPPALTDALRMYEIEGLSQSAIANRLGISLSAAKSRVQRGRQQLEVLLRTRCQLEIDRRGNVIACKPASDIPCEQASCECDEDKRQPRPPRPSS